MRSWIFFFILSIAVMWFIVENNLNLNPFSGFILGCVLMIISELYDKYLKTL